MYLSLFALTLAVSAPVQLKAPHKAPPPCHTLTGDQMREPLTLSEPCYIVNQYASVSAPLTINPGVTVSFGENAALAIEEGGSINATGTAEKPIVLQGKDHTPGFWGGLNITSNSSKNQLSYVTVADAGPKGGSDSGAVIVSIGARLAMDHSTVRDSASFGLNVLQRGTISKFEANHFEDTATPLSFKASDLPMIDAATTYTNNKNNHVLVYFNECEVEDEQTWRALAIPYRFECSPNIKAHLTIEAGARLEFKENTGLDINENGSLGAVGTAEKPIVFTGAEETPGYWNGIYFESKSSKNILQNVKIAYGGTTGSSISSGVCIGVRAQASVTSSEISFSEAAGIRLLQDATVNADAETSNKLHDNKKNIEREQ